jgi:hypothetical protein
VNACVYLWRSIKFLVFLYSLRLSLSLSVSVKSATPGASNNKDFRDYEPGGLARRKGLPVLEDTMIHLDSLEMCQRFVWGVVDQRFVWGFVGQKVCVRFCGMEFSSVLTFHPYDAFSKRQLWRRQSNSFPTFIFFIFCNGFTLICFRYDVL